MRVAGSAAVASRVPSDRAPRSDDAAPPPSVHARAAAAAFGLDPERLERLGAFVSEVVTGADDRGSVVIKVMDPGHRTQVEVLAEIDWLLALREAGVPVAEPYATPQQGYVPVVGNPPRLAVAYRRSPGRHLAPPDWTADLVRAHGRLLGRLQMHTRRWRLPPGRSRLGWLDHATLARAPQALPDDRAFLAAVAEVDARVRAHVPTPADHVGLVHADLHAWNVLVDDHGTLTAIDFDDAVVGPYLFDLSIPLYYAVTTRRDADPAEVADAFLGPYLEGFDAVAVRPPGDAEAVAALLSMRRADLAVAVQLEIPPERWTDELRATSARLRERAVARDEVVPLSVLRKHFG